MAVYSKEEVMKVVEFLRKNPEMSHKKASELYREQGFTYSQYFISSVRSKYNIRYVKTQDMFARVRLMRYNKIAITEQSLIDSFKDISDYLLGELLEYASSLNVNKDKDAISSEIKKMGLKLSMSTPNIIRTGNRTIHASDAAIKNMGEHEYLPPVRVNTFEHAIQQLTR